MSESSDDRVRLAIERRLTRADFLKAAGGTAAGITILGLAGCGGGGGGGGAQGGGAPKRGGMLQVSFSDASTKENLDPGLTTLTNDSFYTGQIYEGLTVADTEWNVHPVLAEKWTANSDVTEWTFNLRQGVKWHDGSDFTSKDVAYTLGRVLDEKFGSPPFSRLHPSLSKEGVSTPDA